MPHQRHGAPPPPECVGRGCGLPCGDEARRGRGRASPRGGAPLRRCTVWRGAACGRATRYLREGPRWRSDTPRWRARAGWMAVRSKGSTELRQCEARLATSLAAPDEGRFSSVLAGPSGPHALRRIMGSSLLRRRRTGGRVGSAGVGQADLEMRAPKGRRRAAARHRMCSRRAPPRGWCSRRRRKSPVKERFVLQAMRGWSVWGRPSDVPPASEENASPQIAGLFI